MKCLSAFILCLICFQGCNRKVSNSILKDYQSIEGIKIGMPITKAIKILNSKFDVELKNIASSDEPQVIEYIVRGKKSKEIFIFNAGYNDSDKNNVFRIVIKSPAYSTFDGVKVGMTVKELKAKTVLKSADFNFEDGLFLQSSVFDGGFWINQDPKINYDFNHPNPSLKEIPSDLIIKGIVLF
jgi:hypothetical protein